MLIPLSKVQSELSAISVLMPLWNRTWIVNNLGDNLHFRFSISIFTLHSGSGLVSVGNGGGYGFGWWAVVTMSCCLIEIVIVSCKVYTIACIISGWFRLWFCFECLNEKKKSLWVSLESYSIKASN